MCGNSKGAYVPIRREVSKNKLVASTKLSVQVKTIYKYVLFLRCNYINKENKISN